MNKFQEIKIALKDLKDAVGFVILFIVIWLASSFTTVFNQKVNKIDL